MRRLLIHIALITALGATPAAADAIVSISVAGPGGSADAFGEFADQAWGRGASGTVFNPHASVHDGLPLASCCGTFLGGQARGWAKVDGTKGLAGATAFAGFLPDDESSLTAASGSIADTLVFFVPEVSIDVDLIGSLFSTVMGDAEGSATIRMLVSLMVPDPGNPDVPFLTLYGGFLIRSRDADGTTRWTIGSTVSGVSEGTGTTTPLHVSDTFFLPDMYLGVPINLKMEVFASAGCSQTGGNCNMTAEAFDTGYLGIDGDYTSTHSYPGMTATVPPQQPPSPPQSLQASTNGLHVTLQWQPPASGTPVNYVITAGTGPGLNDIGQASLGLASSVSAALPAGTYFVRAFAQNAAGTSPASNEVSFTLGTAPPGPPRNLTFSLAGNTLSLAWLPPDTGGPATDYLLDAGTAPGLSNVVAGLPIGGTGITAAGVPAETFFIRVRSRNAAGVSGPSNEVQVSVGPGCTPPSAPQNFTFTKSGFDLGLSWSAPAVGTPPFIYGLLAGSAPGGTNLFFGALGSITSIGGTVPAGNYFVRVITANACGIGPVSNELAISIP